MKNIFLGIIILIIAFLNFPLPTTIVVVIWCVISYISKQHGMMGTTTNVDPNVNKTEHTTECRGKDIKRNEIDCITPRKMSPIGIEFEKRLRRAREQNLQIIGFCDEEKTTAEIHNEESGKTYCVSRKSCECEDFKSGHFPCKHIIYFLLQTGNYEQLEKPFPRFNSSDVNSDGRWIPHYWMYYHGKPTGLGYVNLYPYEVCGRLLGISEKTGKPTNRKKKIVVNALNENDAVTAAREMGIEPPYSNVKFIDLFPSDGQYRYLQGAEIPYPNLMCSRDAGALLTRYEEENEKVCPSYLFDLATKCRASVSYFQEPESVKTAIWDILSEEKKVAAFCYTVYCEAKRYDFGNAPIGIDDEVFRDFEPTKKQKDYICSIYEFGWKGLSKNTTTYKNALLFLKSKGIV